MHGDIALARFEGIELASAYEPIFDISVHALAQSLSSGAEGVDRFGDELGFQAVTQRLDARAVRGVRSVRPYRRRSGTGRARPHVTRAARDQFLRRAAAWAAVSARARASAEEREVRPRTAFLDRAGVVRTEPVAGGDRVAGGGSRAQDLSRLSDQELSALWLQGGGQSVERGADSVGVGNGAARLHQDGCGGRVARCDGETASRLCEPFADSADFQSRDG